MFSNRYIINAAESTAQAGWQAGFQVVFDNDFFGGTDDHYTNGIQLWASSEPLLAGRPAHWGWLSRGAQLLPGINRTDGTRYESLSLSHRIFTPTDIANPDPIDNDVPYSGQLILGLAVSQQTTQELHALSQFGIIGPAAGAADVQHSFHSVINSEEPQGYDHQLPNALAINAFTNTADAGGKPR